MHVSRSKGKQCIRARGKIRSRGSKKTWRPLRKLYSPAHHTKTYNKKKRKSRDTIRKKKNTESLHNEIKEDLSLAEGQMEDLQSPQTHCHEEGFPPVAEQGNEPTGEELTQAVDSHLRGKALGQEWHSQVTGQDWLSSKAP